MTDKTELEILRGQDAEQLLAHPLLVEAFQNIEQRLKDQWEQSPARDSEGREKLYLTLKVLKMVHGEIASVVATGQYAKATLAQRLGQTLNPFS